MDAEARKWREPVERWISDAERVVLAFRRKQAADAAREAEERQHAIDEGGPRQGQAEIMGNTEAIQRPPPRSCISRPSARPSR